MALAHSRSGRRGTRLERRESGQTMKMIREFVISTVAGGLFVVVPIYLAVLLLLKGLQGVGELMRPIAALLPAWMPGPAILAPIALLVFCFLVGAVVRTPAGRAGRERV